MTVSICVILLELTNNLALLPLVMLVLLVAKFTGDSFNRAVYDTHIRLKFMPLLDATPGRALRTVTAAELVAHQTPARALALAHRLLRAAEAGVSEWC